MCKDHQAFIEKMFEHLLKHGLSKPEVIELRQRWLNAPAAATSTTTAAAAPATATTTTTAATAGGLKRPRMKRPAAKAKASSSRKTDASMGDPTDPGDDPDGEFEEELVGEYDIAPPTVFYFTDDEPFVEDDEQDAMKRMPPQWWQELLSKGS